MVLAKTLKINFKEQILQVNNFIERKGYRIVDLEKKVIEFWIFNL